MLGDRGRRNVLARILEGGPEPLALSSSSVLNCVLRGCVRVPRGRLRAGLKRNVCNLAASRNATLGEIAAEFGKRVIWGEHFYDIGNVSNAKAAAVVPDAQVDP